MGASQAAAPTDEVTAAESRPLATSDLRFPRSAIPAEEEALFDEIIRLPEFAESPRIMTPPQSLVLTKSVYPDPARVGAFRRRTASPMHAETSDSELARNQQNLMTALPLEHTLAGMSTLERETDAECGFSREEKGRWKTEDDERATVDFDAHDGSELTKPDIVKRSGLGGSRRHSNAEWGEDMENLLANYADEHVSPSLVQKLDVTDLKPSKFTRAALQVLASGPKNKQQRDATRARVGEELDMPLSTFADLEPWARECFRRRGAPVEHDSEIHSLLTVIMDSFYEAQAHLVNHIIQHADNKRKEHHDAFLTLEHFAIEYEMTIRHELPFRAAVKTSVKDRHESAVSETTSDSEPSVKQDPQTSEHSRAPKPTTAIKAKGAAQIKAEKQDDTKQKAKRTRARGKGRKTPQKETPQKEEPGKYTQLAGPSASTKAVERTSTSKCAASRYTVTPKPTSTIQLAPNAKLVLNAPEAATGSRATSQQALGPPSSSASPLPPVAPSDHGQAPPANTLSNTERKAAHEQGSAARWSTQTPQHTALRVSASNRTCPGTNDLEMKRDAGERQHGTRKRKASSELEMAPSINHVSIQPAGTGRIGRQATQNRPSMTVSYHHPSFAASTTSTAASASHQISGNLNGTFNSGMLQSPPKTGFTSVPGKLQYASIPNAYPGNHSVPRLDTSSSTPISTPSLPPIVHERQGPELGAGFRYNSTASHEPIHQPALQNPTESSALPQSPPQAWVAKTLQDLLSVPPSLMNPRPLSGPGAFPTSSSSFPVPEPSTTSSNNALSGCLSSTVDWSVDTARSARPSIPLRSGPLNATSASNSRPSQQGIKPPSTPVMSRQPQLAPPTRHGTAAHVNSDELGLAHQVALVLASRDRYHGARQTNSVACVSKADVRSRTAGPCAVGQGSNERVMTASGSLDIKTSADPDPGKGSSQPKKPVDERTLAPPVSMAQSQAGAVPHQTVTQPATAQPQAHLRRSPRNAKKRKMNEASHRDS